MAILLADYDEQRDYLSNFEPFVLDRLKAWPHAEEVRPTKLAAALRDEFSLPSIPINTVTALRDRAKRGGFIRRDRRTGKDYPNQHNLESVSEIAPGRTTILAHFTALNDALCGHAEQVFELRWSEAQAERALERFMEDFGVEMALARHEGRLSGSPSASDEQCAVVHSFARHALEREPEHLDYLEEMVKGSMLTNVIYFQDLGSWKPTIDRLIVFLDTPFVLRILELETDEVTSAGLELMRLLASFDIPIRIFEHTVEEVLGVLEAIKNSLTRARRKEFNAQTVSAIHRASVEHLMERGWAAGEIQEIISDIEGRLNSLGVTVEGTPEYTRSLAVDESRFEKTLERFGYRYDYQITKDVRSLTAVHRLRSGRPSADLSKTPAIFITSNTRLVSASNRFFREAGHASPVPHCMSDVSLTTQLWLRRPGTHSDVPRKVLMAESYAALNPSTELWSRYLKKIAKRRAEKAINDRQVKVLVLSGTARAALIEETHGLASRVTDETPLDVLRRYEKHVQQPVLAQASKAVENLNTTQEENARLRKEIEELQALGGRQTARLSTQDRQLDDQDRKLRELEAWRETQELRAQQRESRRSLARNVLGTTVAVAAVVGVLALGVSDTVTEPLMLALLGSVAALAAVSSVGWGFQKGRAWTVKTIGLVSALGGLVGLLYGVLLGETPPEAK